MAQATRVGIIGAGWPGLRHADGYRAAGGFDVQAVADLIPARRSALMQQCGAAREFASYEELLADEQIEAVSICLPNHLHLPAALKALKAGKHVVCEPPPAATAAEAKKIAAAAAKAGKTLLYGFQRRFGGNEQAAKQAIAKGYAGEVYHIRAAWMRTRGVPTGTGWYTERAKSGGGAIIDLGLHMLDLAWHLLGQPKLTSVFATSAAKLTPPGPGYDVEEAGFALLKFEGGQSLELATSWAINQPPQQQGTLCRVHGDKGCIDVYRGEGSALYHKFDAKGQAKEIPLKLPRLVHHAALMRHLRECLASGAAPMVGPAEGLALMQMAEAVYKSISTGKSVQLG